MIVYRRFKTLLFTLVFASFVCLTTSIDAGAQNTTSGVTPDNKSQAEIDGIIKAFSAKETRFRQALNDYAFKRDAVIQTIGLGGQAITGEYHRVSFFTFDNSGNRYEKINFFPQPTLTELSFTAEDLEDLGGIQPFALEAAKIDRYNFRYLGREKIDEVTTYVFDVSPKVMPDPKKLQDRLFLGRVWVDDRDLQIVKVKGKGVPETKNNKYPVFETWRDQVDGRFWFPVYTFADDSLEFGNGQIVRLRMKVTYTDYKKAHTSVKITEANGDELETVPDKNPKPSPSPTPPDPKKP
jgi:hypothetical protein